MLGGHPDSREEPGPHATVSGTDERRGELGRKFTAAIKLASGYFS
jgi:hypothetical protein